MHGARLATLIPDLQVSPGVSSEWPHVVSHVGQGTQPPRMAHAPLHMKAPSVVEQAALHMQWWTCASVVMDTTRISSRGALCSASSAPATLVGHCAPPQALPSACQHQCGFSGPTECHNLSLGGVSHETAARHAQPRRKSPQTAARHARACRKPPQTAARHARARRKLEDETV